MRTVAADGQIRQGGVGAAGGTVLHHDDGGRPVLEEGADAAFEQRPGVVVDHDGADRCRAPGAQYSRVKRNFTSARRALKPSRQVIFFPSSCSRPA